MNTYFSRTGGRFRGARRNVLVAITLSALVCALLPTAAYRADASTPDSDTYYAQVKYYDSIQMKYVVQHGINDYWTTTGDIPIGGFIDGSGTRIIDQAYCVDATVAFHSASETTTSYPGGITTDTTKPGYVVVSPLAVSDGVRANLPSLYWLAVNGFRGERGDASKNNLAAIRARYSALETQYGIPIDETIAIMATKAAVWNFTDPTFALLSTSLSNNPTRYKLMIALMKSLVNDARAEGYSLATTTLNVNFDNNSASFTSDAAGNWYYGPVTASAKASNGAGTPDKIYLTASGMYATEFKFWYKPAGLPTFAPLTNAEPMYGSTTAAPYVRSGDSFYVRVPASVANAALVNIGQSNDMNFAYLALHGIARSADVTYNGTPAIMAWQGTTVAAPTGAQDWGHVQAFIGFVNNIQASLYGEGNLFLRGNNDGGSITVSKAVLGAHDMSNAGSFTFALEVYDNNAGSWVPVPLDPETGGNISGNSGLDGPSPRGVFSLTDGGSVSITNLPFGRYRVSEQTSGDNYSVTHQVNSNSSQTGFAAEVTLGMQATTGTIAFANTLKTHDIPYNGHLTISKAVIGATDETGATDAVDTETRFPFTLEWYNDGQQAWEPVALDPGADGNITGNSGLDALSPNGAFSLSAEDEVRVTGLLTGRYRVTETDSGECTASYRVDFGEETEGAAAETTFVVGNDARVVAFTNTVPSPETPTTPDTPTTPATPTTPTTPTVPTTPDTPGTSTSNNPATGDSGGPALPLAVILLIIGGIGVIACLRALETRRTRE